MPNKLTDAEIKKALEDKIEFKSNAAYLTCYRFYNGAWIEYPNGDKLYSVVSLFLISLVLLPIMTVINLILFLLAVDVRQYPASLVYPVFKPSAPW